MLVAMLSAFCVPSLKVLFRDASGRISSSREQKGSGSQVELTNKGLEVMVMRSVTVSEERRGEP